MLQEVIEWWRSDTTSNGAKFVATTTSGLVVLVIAGVVTWAATSLFDADNGSVETAPGMEESATSMNEGTATTVAESTTTNTEDATTSATDGTTTSTTEDTTTSATDGAAASNTSVSETEPPTNSSLPAAVTLSSDSLLDLDPQSGRWAKVEPLSINGERHVVAASSDTCGGSFRREIVYTLSRQYNRFTGTMGMRDETPIGANSIVTIAKNGQTVLTQEVQPNMSVPFDVDVSDAISLQIIFNSGGDVYCGSDEGPAIGSPGLT